MLPPLSRQAMFMYAGENCITYVIGDDAIELALYAPWIHRLNTPDGVLFLMLSDIIDEQARACSLLFVDGSLTVHPIVELGQWWNSSLMPQQALWSASTGKVLLETSGRALGKKMMIRDSQTGRATLSEEPYGPWLDGLIVVDTATGGVQPLPGRATSLSRWACPRMADMRCQAVLHRCTGWIWMTSPFCGTSGITWCITMPFFVSGMSPDKKTAAHRKLIRRAAFLMHFPSWR